MDSAVAGSVTSKKEGVKLCLEEMVLDRTDRVRVQAEEVVEVVEGAAGVWAAIDPVRVPAGTASAQVAVLKAFIRGENHVLP